MAKNPTEETTVTVYAAGHIVEAGVRYAPGDAITTTAERAAALGDAVKATKPE
jgi:hypothetical protein